jgi:hypothetical protein
LATPRYDVSSVLAASKAGLNLSSSSPRDIRRSSAISSVAIAIFLRIHTLANTSRVYSQKGVRKDSMMLVIRENLLVMATTTRIATTLAYLPPFELSELIMALGRDKMTVAMYSQNFIPVQENRGLARSMRTGSVFSHCC